MIFKVRKHRSKQHLRNLVRYLLSRKGKSNERVLRHESLLALPMLPGETPLGYAKQWASELWSFTAQERVGKKPPEDYFVHSVMSFFPGNAEYEADQLTAEQAVELAKEAMAEVAPGERQVLYVVHGDKAHLHVHIVFSTVELGGRIWNPRMDFRLWEATAARLEVKHGLYRVTVGRAGGEPARRKSPSSNELNMVLRTGQSSDRMLLQQALDAALAGKPSFPKFWQRLLDAGVTPMPRIASTGRVSGISFRYGTGQPMKGSDLGKGYSWNSIAKQLHFAGSQHLHLLRPYASEQQVESGEAQIVPSPKEPPASTIETLHRLSQFIAKPTADRIDWAWRNRPKQTAFVEAPKVFLTTSSHQAVYKAIAERAQARGAKQMVVRGSEAFRRRLWYELSLRGISTEGYVPTNADKLRLEWLENEQTENGRGNQRERSKTSNGGDGPGVGDNARQNAPSESIDKRRIGGSHVSLAPSDDVSGARESGATQGNAAADEQRNEADERRNGGDAYIDEGSQVLARRRENQPRVISDPCPTPYLRRATRLSDAAQWRQGIQPALVRQEWRSALDMLWELERRFTHWCVSFGIPGEDPIGELTRSDELSPNWSNLQVLNSQGVNVQLSLTSRGSWLHLNGVTERDLARLRSEGIEPTVLFTVGGVTEAYVHVNYGIENRLVMRRLAEQVQVGLDAIVQPYIGVVTFPLPGFDCWQGGRLQHCSNVRFDSATIGAQLSVQLSALKGDVGHTRSLVPPVTHDAELPISAAQVVLRKENSTSEDSPRPSGY
ncbi:relaxase/mobilization nuclease domain-containing protein [Ectopseudomonas toyotomiensis]|uniref:relaxase/mobilization nuclease domain-containing protein n=1 Tax=Ectopseudomonas toyotomiensis TaxID=554344 RepID=UPI003D1189C4